jgi:SAM-dependent methyltransferase
MAEIIAETYGEDLAYIHHAGFSGFSERAAPGLLARLRAAGIAEGRVVDLGCGGGAWLKTLGEAGYEAVGIEPSPHLIAIARATAPEATLITGSAHEATLPACAAVTALGEALCYMPRDADEPPPLGRTFARIHDALAPGGLLAFDLIVGGEAPSLTGAGGRAGDDWAVVSEAVEDAAAQRLRRRVTAFRAVGGVYRRSDETHLQHLFTRSEVEGALEAAGFAQIEDADSYGDAAMLPRRRAFFARKS